MRRPRASVWAALTAILALSAALRLWRLTEPPSWLDESMTALIAAARGPDALPLGQVLPLQRVADLFDPHLTATIDDSLGMFHDPRVQDLHPPAYHLMSNVALRAGLLPRWPLVARVRALAALFGIVAVAAMYAAMRQLFEPGVSLLGAALMAVSPYAVMLSREARNYSCGMLLATCAFGATLAIIKRMDAGRSSFGPWIVWVVASIAGLYVHYFTLFAIAGNAAVIGFLAWRARSTTVLRALVAASAAIAAAFLPWIPTLVAQQASPEQRWLRYELYADSPIAVPYKIVSAWQTMLLGKAWEMTPAIYQTSRVVSLLLYVSLLAAVAWALLRRSPESRGERRGAGLLLAIAGVTIAACVGALTLQGKDFVSSVRYHFPYYAPLAGAVAWIFARRLPRAAAAALLVAGLVNSVMVVFDVESWKGTEPPPVLTRLNAAARPTLIVGGSASFNETVVYETILNEYLRQSSAADQSVVLLQRSPLHASFDLHSNPAIFWSALGRLRPPTLPASVMVHNSGMLPAEYPASFVVTAASGQRTTCSGVALDDPAFEQDNMLVRPLYRRYVCAAPAAAVR